VSDEERGRTPDPAIQQPGSEHPESPPLPMVGAVVKKTSRFSAEVVATMISLASAAFGVVAALAWNTAITEAFAKAFKGTSGRLSALFVYAVVVTLIGVVVIVFLGRLAARIKAEPREFKYPVGPRT